ncbi:iron transporter FeoC [Vibrio sp. vnigr-6D03]|uniref:Transcriptional regulator HTH-type FeoC domain-containing protein n=1 Tax=Vibrio penaeicida TaxID=104609 RepID=A0AAV5NN35_9VIBR|nr:MULTISPECIES: FeoC-like transcriptional regulator [Vibrio]PKF78313.1 iron transporter FeoC [Vibrio sp. vnigr-6D03]RTZ21172.1 iron transporter FeoC [Vibrio penaeicida]GLQ71870.1 hypothetical protein GCM10007932_12300 [Vibrio penaeicida]
MILTEISEYMSQNGTVSQSKLARHFHMSEDGVDAMLTFWMKKGKVTKISAKGDHTASYCWISRPEQIAMNVIIG